MNLFEPNHNEQSHFPMSHLSEGVRDVSQQYGRFCMIKVPVGVGGRRGRGGESSLV